MRLKDPLKKKAFPLACIGKMTIFGSSNNEVIMYHTFYSYAFSTKKSIFFLLIIF